MKFAMMNGRDYVEDIEGNPEAVVEVDDVRDVLKFSLPQLRLHNLKNLTLCSSCLKTLTNLKSYLNMRTDCDLPDVKMPENIDDFVNRCIKSFKLDKDSRQQVKLRDRGDGHRKVKKRRSNMKPVLQRITKKARKNVGRPLDAGKKKACNSYSLETIMKNEAVTRESTTDSIKERLKSIEEYKKRLCGEYEDGSDIN